MYILYTFIIIITYVYFLLLKTQHKKIYFSFVKCCKLQIHQKLLSIFIGNINSDFFLFLDWNYTDNFWFSKKNTRFKWKQSPLWFSQLPSQRRIFQPTVSLANCWSNFINSMVEWSVQKHRAFKNSCTIFEITRHFSCLRKKLQYI